MRKVAAELNDVPTHLSDNSTYFWDLPSKGFNFDSDPHYLMSANAWGPSTGWISAEHPVFKDIDSLRKAQASGNATAIQDNTRRRDDKYNLLRKHLIDYGRTKHFNHYNPENPKPMPKYKGPELSPAEQKRLTEAEDLQANNRRNNPYSKTV